MWYLSPAATHEQLLKHFQYPEILERLVAMIHTEPLRVRVMLGAVK